MINQGKFFTSSLFFYDASILDLPIETNSDFPLLFILIIPNCALIAVFSFLNSRCIYLNYLMKICILYLYLCCVDVVSILVYPKNISYVKYIVLKIIVFLQSTLLSMFPVSLTGIFHSMYQIICFLPKTVRSE